VVAIAERLNITEVASLDQRHFPNGRPRHAEYLTILPWFPMSRRASVGLAGHEVRSPSLNPPSRRLVFTAEAAEGSLT